MHIVCELFISRYIIVNMYSARVRCRRQLAILFLFSSRYRPRESRSLVCACIFLVLFACLMQKSFAQAHAIDKRDDTFGRSRRKKKERECETVLLQNRCCRSAKQRRAAWKNILLYSRTDAQHGKILYFSARKKPVRGTGLFYSVCNLRSLSLHNRGLSYGPRGSLATRFAV